MKTANEMGDGLSDDQTKALMSILERSFYFRSYVKLYPDFEVRLGEILDFIPPDFETAINDYIKSIDNQESDLLRLQDAMDLSQAEASLVLLLVNGKNLVDIARERNVSRNTVRNQLHNIYQKTHVNRQPALIRLALDVLER